MACTPDNYFGKPRMWKNADNEGYPANEHGVSDGHFTCHTHYLIYLLDYAIATHNDWLKQFVREAYDYQRAGGVSRMGWYWPGAQEGDFTVFQSRWASGFPMPG